MPNVFLRLPFHFDPALLQADLQRCMQSAWPQHFHKEDYTGEWTSVALRSASGDPFDISSIPGNTYVNTPLAETCAYFREVLSAFQFEMETVRLLRLGPGSMIHPHKDPAAGYQDNCIRIHIPVTTNAQTSITVAGETRYMKPGECWYADFSQEHSVRNDGKTDRVHLVIDGLRNEWSDALFASAGYDFEAEKELKKIPPQQIRLMIDELRRQNTPASLRLAHSLEQELGAGA